MIALEGLRYSIEEIIKKEDETGEERKKVHKYEDSIVNTDKKINDYKKQLNELQIDISKLEEDIDKCNGDRLNLKIQLDVVKKISEKTIAAYESNLRKTEEIQQLIWDNRMNYCQAVSDFIKNYGLAATLNRNFDLKVRGQMADALCDTDALRKIDGNKQSQENTSNFPEQVAIFQKLQCQVNNEKLLDSEIINELKNILTENERLEKDYQNGQEFKRLRNAYKYSRDGLLRLQIELRKIEEERSNQIANESIYNRSRGQSPCLPQTAIIDSSKWWKMEEYTTGQFSIDEVRSTNSAKYSSINKDSGVDCLDASSTRNPTTNQHCRQSTSGSDIYLNNFNQEASESRLSVANNSLQSGPTRCKDVYKEIIKKKATKRRQKTIFTYVVPKKSSK